MRSPACGRWLALTALAGAFLFGLLLQRPAQAGGPLDVGGGQPPNLGADGVPFTWRLSPDGGLVSGGQIQYRTDGGGLGVLANATANTRVEGMFQVWEDVPTSNIAFNRAGALLVTGAFTDGNVTSGPEFDAVLDSCSESHPQAQNPIIYDADGSLFTALGLPSGVIGFAGACELASDGVTNRIAAAVAALNGKFRDGNAGNGELTDNEFDGVFIHEFGHLFGLDHSQINLNCLTSAASCPNGSDDLFGLPTMFPFLLGGREETPGVHPARTLSLDDRAWVSRLYPDASFNSSFGTVSGTILFSDGQTHFQGANVVARQVDDPMTPEDESRRNAVSCVSGYLFTINTGQSVTGNNPGSLFGSRNPLNYGRYDIPVPGGTYTVEVESIHPAFLGGSRVGPVGDLGFQYPVPAEFFSDPETDSDNPADSAPVSVLNGAATAGIDIILNGTAPRFDQFESSDIVHLRWNLPPPAWVRREHRLSQPMAAA